MTPAVAAASTYAGVRVIRPWTRTIATIDIVLTRARRLTEQTRATGEQQEADAALATILGARADTPSVVLGMRYERVLGEMTYAERDQLLTSVRACARVPEEFRPFMERARAIERQENILTATEFQSAVMARSANRNLVNKSFQLCVERMPQVWAVEVNDIYRRTTGHGLSINMAEVVQRRWEGGNHTPGVVKGRWLGVDHRLLAARSEKWVHIRFEDKLQELSPVERKSVLAAYDALTQFAEDFDVAWLQALLRSRLREHVDKVQLYRYALYLPETMTTTIVRDRVLGALRRATALVVALYREVYWQWVGRPDDFYCKRARKAMREVERDGHRITHDVFKRRVLDAPASMSHDAVLQRYVDFRAEVFTAEEKTFLDAAQLACTGYKDGRCGKAQHEEFERIVAARVAFATQLAMDVQSGAASHMAADAYEAALMAQGKPMRAKSAHTAYKGFLTYLDAGMRQQFLAWRNIICRPNPVLTVQRLQSAMTCALETQERIARGGAYLSVGDFQWRVITNSSVLEIGTAYYRFRDALDLAQQECLDAYMLAATGRPPHWRGRHPPRHAQVSLAGLAQRGEDVAFALIRAGTAVSPTMFYQQLFGATLVAVTELRRLFALVQRQAAPADQVRLDAALGLATNTLWLNGRTIPVAYLQPRGVNDSRQWWIAQEAGEWMVTSVTPEYLDAVVSTLHALRAATT